jgi:hypothetical protein
MDTFWQDIRFGFRTLLRSPATSAVALLSPEEASAGRGERGRQTEDAATS